MRKIVGCAIIVVGCIIIYNLFTGVIPFGTTEGLLALLGGGALIGTSLAMFKTGLGEEE